MHMHRAVKINSFCSTLWQKVFIYLFMLLKVRK